MYSDDLERLRAHYEKQNQEEFEYWKSFGSKISRFELSSSLDLKCQEKDITDPLGNILTLKIYRDPKTREIRKVYLFEIDENGDEAKIYAWSVAVYVLSPKTSEIDYELQEQLHEAVFTLAQPDGLRTGIYLLDGLVKEGKLVRV